VSILEAMASIYSCLGYMRKEAYILREVLGCLLDLMVCGREEDGFSYPSGVPSSAGLGIQPISGVGVGWGSVGVRLSESVDGNSSILHLLIYVCQVLGINLEAVRMINSVDRLASLANDRESILKYEEEVMEGFKEPYGWPELQVGVVREAVAVAEALPGEQCHVFLLRDDKNPPLRLSFCCAVCAVFLENSTVCIISRRSVSPLFHVYAGTDNGFPTRRCKICRILVRTTCYQYRACAVRLYDGLPQQPPYITLMDSLPSVRLPVEKPWSTIQLKFGDPTPLLQGRDPFLYNPRKALVDKVTR
jgi:hypothetical protein